MNSGDLVFIDHPPRQDYGIFVRHLPFDRMCEVEIVKEKKGGKLKAPDQKGIILIVPAKILLVVLTLKERYFNDHA